MNKKLMKTLAAFTVAVYACTSVPSFPAFAGDSDPDSGGTPIVSAPETTDISEAEFSLPDETYTYSGSEITPEPWITIGDTILVKDQDYTLSYDNNVNAGSDTAVIQAEGIGAYSGKASCTFTIEPLEVTPGEQQGGSLDCTYTGQALEPKPVLTGFTEGTDYDLSYENNVEIGTNTASVTVTFKGNYTGSCTWDFSILPIDAEGFTVTLAESSFEYTGEEIKPAPEVYLGETRLTKDIDYTLSYSGNISAGTDTAVVTVTGTGIYSGSKSCTFSILPMDISGLTVSIPYASYEYTGSAVEPAVTVKKDGYTLIAGTDYTVAYADNIAAGTAKITVTGKGSCTGSCSAEFTITPADVSGYKVTIPKASYEYTGSAIKPAVTVKKDGIILTADTDYTVAYADNIAAGTAKITVTGKGSCTGSCSAEFTITPADVSGYKVTIPKASYEYTGSAIKPAVTVKKDGVKLDPDTDYTVSYSNNVNIGQATITVKGKGNYSGTVSREFSIIAIALSGGTVSLPYSSYQYSGDAIRPTVTVKKNGKKLTENTDFTVSYSDNVKVGTATITVTGKGIYSGKLTRTFIVKPKPGTLTLTTGSGAFKASWPKDSTASGYQVVYSKDKTFASGTTTYGVSSNSTTSVNFSSKPKAGETWYVKYRAYLSANGTKYGNFSSVKSIKVLGTVKSFGMPYTSYTYTGSAIKPAVNVKDTKGNKLKASDYTVTYSSNTKVGTASVTVTGKGSYNGTVKRTFTIKQRAISAASRSIPSSSYKYTGSAVKPKLTVKYGGKTLTEKTDYTVAWADNKNVGTATITITGKGNFTGTATKTFKITARPVSDCKAVFEITDASGTVTDGVYYNGKAQKPLPKVTYGNVTFKNGTDYTLSYSNNTNTGKATVTITGKGRLSGTKKVTFKIKPWDVVKDFGAKPDDSKDDRDAINKALWYAKDMPSDQKYEVYIPAGKYYISNTLYIYSNTRLVLDKNAVIINKTSKPMLVPLTKENKADGKGGYSLTHDISVEGGTWDFNGKNVPDKNESKAIFVFRNSKNFTVRNTTLTHAYGNHFIICDGMSGLKVENVSFKDFVSYTGKDSIYEFTKSYSDAGKKKSAIGSVEALHLDFASDKTPCTNVTVTGCTFTNVPSGIGTHHTNSKYSTNISIYSNTFKNVWFTCVHAGSFKSFKVYDNTASNTAVLFRSEDSQGEVYNNSLTGLSSVPSSRYNTSDTIYTVLIQENSKINFHDNTVKGSNGTGTMFKNNGSLDNVFKNNTIDGAAVDGMFIENTKVSVTYNTIKGCKRDGVRALASKVTCTNNNITGNREKYANFYRGCTASVCKDNGITEGSAYTFAKDSSVSTGNNLRTISGMSASIPQSSWSYTGSAVKPKVTVKNGSSAFSASNYTVTYLNNTKKGTATILIEGKGTWRGFIRKTFTIK